MSTALAPYGFVSVLLGSLLGIQVAHAQSCQTRSGDRPPAVVELYTEGCSSCPPADRWFSSIEPGSEVVALAFHVNYWNHLGWTDRFATPATTERQYAVKAASGSAYVYTPQVVLNGKDLRNWRGQSAGKLARLANKDAPALELRREGAQVSADVSPSQTARELAGFWAVLEDGQVSRVKSGENAGSTLKHDHVVSLYQPVPRWNATSGQRLSLQLPASTADQRVAFVVTDTQLTTPVQALLLACR